MSDYFEVFKSLKITTIIRLNTPEYDRSLSIGLSLFHLCWFVFVSLEFFSKPLVF